MVSEDYPLDRDFSTKSKRNPIELVIVGVLAIAVIAAVVLSVIVLIKVNDASSTTVAAPPGQTSTTQLPTTSSASSSAQFPALDALRPQVPSSVQESAVVQLLQRVLPNHADQFQINIQSSDHLPDGFAKISLSTDGQRIRIVGNSGVDAAMAVQRYLRDCCNAHFSWDGNQLDTLPTKLPLPSSETSVSAIGKLRYFANICTFSYSFVWWKWDRWERFIDWLALSGFNLPLAPVGQEFVWQEVWRQFGLTQSEIDDHFPGPAFLSWFRMGNLRKWGGPMSQAWLTGQKELQKQILDRMLSLGMMPVLPTFAGHVPPQMRRLYPNSTINKVGCWNGFEEQYTCLDTVEPLDPLFAHIAQTFMKKQREVYGLYGLATHAYSADPFNEMEPSSLDLTYLADVARAIFSGAADTDSQAIWVLQGWMFFYSGTWTNERTKAFLSGIPKGRVLVLDLFSENAPCYSKFESYYGQPFIWNMLHNFGGISEFRGSFDEITQGISNALIFPNVTMVGAGLTMEGIYQNYIQYQFMIDRIWSSDSLDQQQWLSTFISQRYGHADNRTVQAWNELRVSVYNETQGVGRIPWKGKIDLHSVNTRSDFEEKRFATGVFKRPQMSSKLALWYDPKRVCSAWTALLSASDDFKQNDFYKRDLIDVTREVLQLIAADRFIYGITVSYNSRSAADVASNGTGLNTLFVDLDAVLSLDSHFSLADWLASARAKGSTPDESRLFDMNARNQLTLWGPRGEIVDYARKQWSGLIEAYYRPRWALFTKEVLQALTDNKNFDQDQFAAKVFQQIESPFGNIGGVDQLLLAKDTPSDWVDTVKRLYNVYFDLCQQLTL